MDLGRWEQRGKPLVMPNGISARYQGKAYVSTCAEWVYICINLGGTAEVVYKAFVLEKSGTEAFFDAIAHKERSRK